MMPIRGTLLAVAAAGLLAACAEPPPPPTAAALTVAASQDVNGGVPVKVQVFYLSSPAAFEAADYFTLSGNPRAALGADLVGVDEYLLAPGQTATAQKTFLQPPAAVGVVAGFRNVDQPGWKATAPLAPNTVNGVTVSVGASTVSIENKAE